MIKTLIRFLEDLDAAYRECSICTHLDEPVRADYIFGDYESLVLSPCLGCRKRHECFKLDEEKLQETIDLGLLTRRQARNIIRKENERNNYYDYET